MAGSSTVALFTLHTILRPRLKIREFRAKSWLLYVELRRRSRIYLPLGYKSVLAPSG